MSEYCTCATSFDGSCQLHDRIDALTTENAALRSRLADSLKAEEWNGMQLDKAERSLTWLWAHCRAIGMTKQAESSPDVHQFAMDIALFTADLETERALLVTRAENAEAAMVEAERDAERYRWLRDEQPNECCCSWSKHLMDVPNTEFDAAIDAVMEEP